MVRVLVFVIRLYQKFISPLTPRMCRFYPTCSEYAVQSLYKHGVAKGSIKALIRITKCHPFHPGGYDPV